MLASSGAIRVHILILGIITGIVVPVRLGLKHRFAAERRTIEIEGRRERTRELASRWNSLIYTEITKSDVTDLFLGKINWSELNLSALQKERLEALLKQLLSYLKDPTMQEYYRLKTEGLHWQFEPNEQARRISRIAGLISADRESPGAHEIVALVWEGRSSLKTGALTEIALDSINVAASQTNSLQSMLGSKVCKGFTAAQAASDPGFKYASFDRPAPAGSFEALFVHLSFFAHSSNSENAGPVYICLLWCEADQHWALSRMFTDALLKVNLLF